MSELRMAAVAVLLSLVMTSAQTPTGAGEFATLRGTVTEVGTGVPLGGVAIHLDSRLTPPVARTDAAGGFVAAGLEPGTYVVFAERDGLVLTEACRGRPERPCVEVRLPPDQVSEIGLEMRRAAALSGHVHDSSGEPVAGVRVSLETYDYTSGPVGERVLVRYPTPGETHNGDLADCRTVFVLQFGPQDPALVSRCDDLGFGDQIGRAITNEEGEWRLEGVPPGQYYVVVSVERAEALDRVLPDRQMGTWLPIYFPDTPSADNALPVTVTSVSEVAGIDIRWTEQTPVSNRGNVTGLPEVRVQTVRLGDNVIRLGDLDVTITTAEGLPVPTVGGDLLHRMSNEVDPAGAFEFLVPPSDEYVLTAIVGGSQHPSHSGRLRVNVGTSDVDGVVLAVVPAGDVSGQIVFDPPLEPEAAGRVWVSFGYRSSNGTYEVGSPVAPDGTFVFAGPARRDWEMSAVELPPGYYVESASYGAVDLLRDAFNPADTPGSVILIRAVDSPGRVTGQVVDTRGNPVEGAEVTLVPEGGLAGRRDLYRISQSAAGGGFSFNTVPPGAYRAFAWEAIQEGAWRNRDFLIPFLGRGRFFTLAKAVTVDLELPLIQP